MSKTRKRMLEGVRPWQEPGRLCAPPAVRGARPGAGVLRRTTARWLHGKRAIVEPTCTLTADEIESRV